METASSGDSTIMPVLDATCGSVVAPHTTEEFATTSVETPCAESTVAAGTKAPLMLVLLVDTREETLTSVDVSMCTVTLGNIATVATASDGVTMRSSRTRG
jgi:hypothetical protein